MDLSGGSHLQRVDNMNSGLCLINDFSPEWDYIDGGTKLLITGLDFIRGRSYHCLFGDREVNTSYISPSYIYLHHIYLHHIYLYHIYISIIYILN